MPPPQLLTRQEVASNGNGKDGKPSLVIVNGDVLDVSSFASGHPGGEKILLDYAGQDCTEVFYSLHRHEVLERRLNRLKVGELKDYDRRAAPQSWTALSKVPFAEINMTMSPYWKDTHHRLRMAYRKFLWESGTYEASDKCEETGDNLPAEIRKKNGRAGVLALCVGRGDLLKRVPEPNLWSEAGIKPEEIDQFHIAVMVEERSRMVCPGAEDALVSGISIGLGPVLHLGPKWMQGQLVQDILMGDKVICLAITEPQVGSDVASCVTSAVKSADGTHYVVNGTKKWITNSVFADYATTLVRTGGKGAGGLSLLLVDLHAEGVTVKKIPTDYSMAAGTGLIIMENVKVPVENLLGKEGEGFAGTMMNFNGERWGIVSMVLGRCRRIIEECFLWANQRLVFGKPLITQPVIQNYIADMVSQLEACYAMYEKLTALYNTLPREQHVVLAGPTALLKYRATRVSNFVADKACQIVGGRSITRTGMGKSVQRFQRFNKGPAVYGGSEEVMAQLALKQAVKQFPRNHRM